MPSIKLCKEPDDALSTEPLLSFPRLKNLIVDQVGYDADLTHTTVEQKLCPSIESIFFFSWANGFDKDLLAAISSKCPRLRSIKLERINTNDTDVTPKDFDNFFRIKPFESIRLDFPPPLMSVDLISTFANMKTLTKLSITERLTPQQIPGAFSNESASFFQNLHEVDLMLDRESVEPITLAIRHASKVDLNIWSQPDEQMTMFSNLKHMVNLKELELEFEGDGTLLQSEDLCCFGTLTNLEHLVCAAREEDYDPIILESSDDADLRRILPGLPRLQRLEWLLETDISVETLETLSTHCPELSLANFLGSWDLVALTDVPGCLFPELRNLTLCKPHVKTRRGPVPARRCAVLILRHAPKLEKFTFVEKPQSNVLLAWRKLKEAKRQFRESSFEQLVSTIMNDG
ncbi:hypothetical protein KCU81_g6428, partial [Aureobasidium melanogenum]|uniref:RNI-like protein n=1 Tax=Aureobasidium melanogenum (strain CBS 110374) TaxID=1043003 RepID=A0A074WG64_AURM1